MLKQLSIAGAALLAACAATAEPPRQTAAEPSPPVFAAQPAHAARVAPAVDCDVRTVRTAHGLRIEGVVRAARPIDGEYALSIRKSGGGGSSDIEQGGPFSAGPERSVTLSGAEIGMGRGARVHAALRIAEDGREVCRRDVRI